MSITTTHVPSPTVTGFRNPDAYVEKDGIGMFATGHFILGRYGLKIANRKDYAMFVRFEVEVPANSKILGVKIKFLSTGGSGIPGPPEPDFNVSGGFLVPDDKWENLNAVHEWEEWSEVPMAQYFDDQGAEVTNNSVFQGGAPAFDAVTTELGAGLWVEFSFGDGLDADTKVTGLVSQLQNYIHANESLRGHLRSEQVAAVADSGDTNYTDEDDIEASATSVPVMFHLYGDFIEGLHWQGLLQTDYSTNEIYHPKITIEYRPIVPTLSALGSGTSSYALEGASTGQSFLSNAFNTTTEKRLTTDSGSDDQPAWSPDGTKIAFSSTRLSDREIWVVDADGSNETRITTMAGLCYRPTWSPDGSKIAFSNNSDIFTINSDGSGSETNITNKTSGEQFHEPAWSPDGTKIAIRHYIGSGSDWDIWVMDADGTNRTALTSGEGTPYYPAWSPDGSKIAFRRSVDIYVMDADGSNQTNLTNDASSDKEPTWSPDGTQIAFYSYRDGSWEIYVMDADGDNVTQITDSAGNNVEPSWSPDGTKIAFKASRDGNDEIYTISRIHAPSYSVSGSGTSTYSIEGEAISAQALIGDSISTIALEGG